MSEKVEQIKSLISELTKEEVILLADCFWLDGFEVPETEFEYIMDKAYSEGIKDGEEFKISAAILLPDIKHVMSDFSKESEE